VKIEADNNDITEHPHDDKEFATRETLSLHKRAHNEQNWYSCSQCDKRFSHHQSLSRHMNVHSSKYKCTECGKCFKGSNALTVHMRSHSGEKPFECSLCSKRFTTSSNLVQHRRHHSGDESLYKCHLCGKAFIESESLSTHMRVHVGDELYKCSFCEKSFTTSSDLQAHNVHSNRRPYDCCNIEVKTEAGSNDITECFHDDRPISGMFCFFFIFLQLFGTVHRRSQEFLLGHSDGFVKMFVGEVELRQQRCRWGGFVEGGAEAFNLRLLVLYQSWIPGGYCPPVPLATPVALCLIFQHFTLCFVCLK